MKKNRLAIEPLESRVTPTLTPKSYVIAIDGLRGDGILNTNTPYLRSIIDGTWGDAPGIDYRAAYADFAQTVPDAVTVSGPNHTTIFTGVTAVDHGVTGNNDAQMAAVTYPDYLELLELDNPNRKTAKLVSWSSDYLIPTGADYSIDSDDELDTQLAADIFAGLPGTTYASATGTTAIDALFIFYDDLDYAGHSQGFSPGVPHYADTLAEIDGQIGLALNAIKARPTFAQEDWQIVLTSDHGGRTTGHGYAAADNYTIPLLVCSRSASQGWMTGTPGNMDVTPTVLNHFGVSLPAYLDGQPRGGSVRTFPPTTPTQDLVVKLDFDFNTQDSSGNNLHASIGGGSPTYVTGKFGQAVSLNAATGDWLTIGNPAALQFGTATDFSFSLWYKAESNLNGNPLILSNKDWNIAGSDGFALSANQGAGRSVGANLADGTNRRDWNQVDIALGQWVFMAGTYDRDGNGFLYVGSENVLYKLAQPISNLGDINTALPWNIGQDGTHAYAQGLTAAIDELSIWRRELTHEEIRAQYDAGVNTVPPPPIIAVPDSYTMNEDATLNVSAPGLLTNDVRPETVIYSENFDAMTLGPAVDETGGDGTDFTHIPPAGWVNNSSGVPGYGTGNDGVTEWAGWSFADKDFWTTVSGNQNRTDFVRGSGVIAVADPDEWDDASHPSGTYNTFLTTPAISLADTLPNSVKLKFDSSFRAEGNMFGSIDLSYDDFATSTRIFTRLTEDARNEPVSIPINNPAGGSVKFRFGLTNAGNNWWWAVDNIRVTRVMPVSVLTAALVTQPANGVANVNADGSFTYIPNANFSGTDSFTYSTHNGTTSTTAPVSITVRPRPEVASMTINDGDPQRSMIRFITVAFDSILDATALAMPGTFTLTRAGHGTVGAVNVTTSNSSGATVATLTFEGVNTNYNSLADGYWTLAILGANVIDASSGLAMDDFTQSGIKRFFGDSDLNGLVDASDFASFGSFFGATVADNLFDFNSDGTINAIDFAEFGNRFGHTL